MGECMCKIGAGVGQGVAAGACAILNQKSAKHKMAKLSVKSFKSGSKGCPILSECRDVGEGIFTGDIKRAAINSGFLVLYII